MGMQSNGVNEPVLSDLDMAALEGLENLFRRNIFAYGLNLKDFINTIKDLKVSDVVLCHPKLRERLFALLNWNIFVVNEEDGYYNLAVLFKIFKVSNKEFEEVLDKKILERNSLGNANILFFLAMLEDQGYSSKNLELMIESQLSSPHIREDVLILIAEQWVEKVKQSENFFRRGLEYMANDDVSSWKRINTEIKMSELPQETQTKLINEVYLNNIKIDNREGILRLRSIFGKLIADPKRSEEGLLALKDRFYYLLDDGDLKEAKRMFASGEMDKERLIAFEVEDEIRELVSNGKVEEVVYLASVAGYDIDRAKMLFDEEVFYSLIVRYPKEALKVMEYFKYSQEQIVSLVKTAFVNYVNEDPEKFFLNPSKQADILYAFKKYKKELLAKPEIKKAAFVVYLSLVRFPKPAEAVAWKKYTEIGLFN